MEQKDFLDPMAEKKLPGSINVLTILTFIGSGIGIIGGIWTFANAQKSYDSMLKFMNGDDIEKVPAFMRKMFTPEMLESTRKSLENKFPILILTLVASALCIYGAIEMRKLKAMGYWAWLIGEILPFLTIILFIGFAQLSGITGYIAIGITALFVLLYTLQRKYLTK